MTFPEFTWRSHTVTIISLYIILFCLFFGNICAVFNVPCAETWIQSPSSGTCLKYYDEKKSWNDARIECKSLQADLIRIDFEAFNKEILDYLKDVKNDNDRFYIGLAHTNDSIGWAWLDSTEQTIYDDFRSRRRGNQCAYTYLNRPGQKSWSSGSCDVNQKFICQKEGIPGVLCPVGWIPNHHSGSCFKLNTKDLSYADNRRSCQIQGGDLAMILEANTNAFLTRMVIARSEVNSSFVGLNDLQVEGTFRWLDFKDPVNYTAWDADQPDNRNQNEHCLVLANYYLTDRQKWIDYVCQAPLLGICEKYADCLMETYGAFCPVDCSKTRCRGVCNPRTGSCLECRPGYQGLFCEKSCPHNRYGDNCGENCSLNCAGTQGCDTVTGKCLGGCKGEFAGDKCDREKCPINNWGLNCALKCSENCAGAEGCDDISGDCVSGCKSGFQGGNCTQGNCPKNTYGEDCSNTCSEGCAGTQGCDSISGSCLDGCKAGLEGDKCKKGLGSNNTIQDASGRKVAGMTPNKTTEGESATKGNNSLWFLFFLIPFLLLIIILMILLKKKQRKRKDQGLEEEFDAHLPAVEEEAERPPPEVAAEEVGEGAAPVVAEESVENQNLSPEPAPVKKLSNV